MDTSRFELTDDEISQVKADYANGDMDAGYKPEHFKAKNWGEAAICKAQVAKVLSMLEPVQKAESLTRDESGQWWINYSDGVKVRLNDSHNWIAEQTRQDTLREVGEWLRSKSYDGEITEEEVKSFERGVLPEGEVK